jgi:hypothetical protein
MILIDDVVVEDLADFLRRRDAVPRLYQRRLVLLADNIHAQFDTLIADEHRRPGDELAHFVLALAAEGAIERVLRIVAADFTHSIAPVDSASRTRLLTWRPRASLNSHPCPFRHDRPSRTMPPVPRSAGHTTKQTT